MRRLLGWAAVCAAATAGPDALAFTHVVQAGETLAQIAERTYGRIQYERILVSANALDAQGGTPIVPGMRLEVPAVEHWRVTTGETWAGLAKQLLGAAERADVLAQANDAMPWVPPADGAEIVVPYDLRVVAGRGDTIVTIAQKYLGDRDRAWILDRYNQRKGQAVRPGDVLLVPLVDLPLTDAARAELAAADSSVRSQAAGQARDAQRKVDQELPALLADVRGGRYVDAVVRGGRLLEVGAATKAQQAAIHRQLLESFVALEAAGQASASCAAWRDLDPRARLDPVQLSPKILAACGKAGRAP